MKNKLFHSIGFKIIGLYALLSLINVSFVVTIIFENQVDLISRNTALESEQQLVSLIDSMKKFTIEMKKGTLFNIRTDTEIIKQLTGIIGPHVDTYLFFTEKGVVLHKSDAALEPPPAYIKDGLRLMTVMTFTGKDYYIRINEEKKLLYCYIPLQEFNLSDTILLVQKDIGSISESLSKLYFQAVYVIFVVLFFHVIFALVLFRYIIHPVRALSRGSRKLLEGDLGARVSVERDDEFSELADTFNKMAESIHENVRTLTDEVEKVKENREKIERTAMRDELTGLYNRNYLLERVLEESIRHRVKKSDLAFLIVNIDHFHELNKIYGHQTGDIILMETAKTVMKACGDGEIIARFGGDEFALMSPYCSLKHIQDIAEKIRSSIELKSIITPDGEFSSTVSIGIAYLESSRLNAEDAHRTIIQSAEAALMQAKQLGRNRIEINT